MYIHLHTTYWTRQTVSRNQDLLLQQLLNWKRDGKMASEKFWGFAKMSSKLRRWLLLLAFLKCYPLRLQTKIKGCNSKRGALKTFVKLVYKSMIWSSVMVSKKTQCSSKSQHSALLYIAEWMSRPYFSKFRYQTGPKLRREIALLCPPFFFTRLTPVVEYSLFLVNTLIQIVVCNTV